MTVAKIKKKALQIFLKGNYCFMQQLEKYNKILKLHKI